MEENAKCILTLLGISNLCERFQVEIEMGLSKSTLVILFQFPSGWICDGLGPLSLHIFVEIILLKTFIKGGRVKVSLEFWKLITSLFVKGLELFLALKKEQVLNSWMTTWNFLKNYALLCSQAVFLGQFQNHRKIFWPRLFWHLCCCRL